MEPMKTSRIGQDVSLRAASSSKGMVIDFEDVDDDGCKNALPYLVEWENHTMSWHAWIDLEPAPPRA
jgi:hypothetical protein